MALAPSFVQRIAMRSKVGRVREQYFHLVYNAARPQVVATRGHLFRRALTHAPQYSRPQSRRFSLVRHRSTSWIAPGRCWSGFGSTRPRSQWENPN